MFERTILCWLFFLFLLSEFGIGLPEKKRDFDDVQFEENQGNFETTTAMWNDNQNNIGNPIFGNSVDHDGIINGDDSQINDGFDNQIGDGFDNQIDDGFDNQINDGFDYQINDGFDNQINDGFDNQIGDGFDNQINDGFDNQIGDGFDNQIDVGFDNIDGDSDDFYDIYNGIEAENGPSYYDAQEGDWNEDNYPVVDYDFDSDYAMEDVEYIDEFGNPIDVEDMKHTHDLLEEFDETEELFIYDEDTGMGFTQVEEDEFFGSDIKRLEQSFAGIKIDGASVVEQEYKGGEVWLINKKTGKPTRKVKRPTKKKKVGTVTHKMPADIKTFDAKAYNASKAMDKFIELRGGSQPDDLRDFLEEILFSIEYGNVMEVVYRVSFLKLGDEFPSVPTGVYNSTTLELLSEWDGIEGAIVPEGTGPGGNANTGKVEYGKDERKNLKVDELGNGTCTFSTGNVTVMDLKHKYDMDAINTSFSYKCFHQDSDKYNGGYSALNDALHHAETVWQFFDTWYHRKPMKNGTVIKVHYGENLIAANFYPKPSGYSYIFIGDGGKNQFPLTTLPLIAHEIAHGLTHETSKLGIGSKQYGALNEFFSDATAMAIQRFVIGSNDKIEWKIGKHIFRNTSNQFRCMDDPTCLGSKSGVNAAKSGIDHVKNLKKWGQGTYEQAGIWRKVFYTLSQKYDVWDLYDFFYVANTKFWQPKTNFKQGAQLLLRAVNEMKQGLHLTWDYDHIKVKDFIDAFNEVGIKCTEENETYKCEGENLT